LNEFPFVKKVIDESVAIKESITVTKRTYYSISHVQASAQFARLSAKIERTYEKRSDEVFHEHRAYVTGSIFASVSFLEATINELFADTVDNLEAVKQLNPEVRALMADMWKLKVPRTARYSTLEKFQIALILARKQQFDTGQSPYQDVALLVELRNALVHYEPEWVTTISEAEPEAVTIQKLEKKLEGKFQLNPMTGEGDTFFPDRCLSHGCAKWAVTSSVKFADEFFSRMGLPPPYDHVRSRMKTE